MKLREIILSVIVLFNANSADAQNQKGQLLVGDVVPDTFIPKIINSAKYSINLSEYKDKLLILDFWNTGCSSCIRALSHMDKLQKQFGNKITILPVDGEEEARIRDFWQRNHYTKQTSLPTVVEDKILRTYFPALGVPHEVWIYKGKVIAITDAEHVNEINIAKVLRDEKVDWPVKNDFLRYDPKKPIFQVDPKQVDTVTGVQYTAVSGYMKNFIGGFSQIYGVVKHPESKSVRTFLLNRPLFDAYNIMWGQLVNVNSLSLPSWLAPNRVVWEVSDKKRYLYMRGTELSQEDIAICYESIRPDTGQTNKELYKAAIDDLNALFGLNVRWEKRKEKVLVLVRTSKVDKLKRKKEILFDEQAIGWTSEKVKQVGNLYQYRDSGLPIAFEMNNQADNPYVYDETGYTGNVDMDLTIQSWTDIAGIRKSITKYDLALKEEERLVDKFIFTEIDGGLIVDVAYAEKRKAQEGMAVPTPEENRAFMELNKKKAGIITLPSGVQYKVLKAGTGAKPVAGDKVKVHYQGTLVNGKIFDNSYERSKPSVFGVKDVIPGWTEALQLMPVGSKWEIYIPAEQAYGTHTNQGRIPPNSNLVFEVELFGIVK